jgi:UDP-glucose 4-epimerase
MQLLAACQKSEGISRLIVKSTSSIYGAGPKDPAMFTEDTEPRSQPRSGWAKDSVEVEAYVRGFARRRPDVAVTTLRFANFLGPKVDTPMAGYFGLPVVPTVLGHDARLQFVHEDDGLEVIRRAVLADLPGTYNVAGDGILMLSQALRLAGKSVLPVPTPFVATVGGWFRRAGLADFSPEQIKFLTYGRGLDTSRLRERFGYTPAYSTRDAFIEFVHERGLDSALPKHRAESIERGLAHALGSSTLSEARLAARLREEAPGRA